MFGTKSADIVDLAALSAKGTPMAHCFMLRRHCFMLRRHCSALRWFRAALVALLACAALTSCGGDKSCEADLAMLDEAIARSPEYFEAKETRISALKLKLAAARSAEERYWLGKDIFAEYKDFDADSAMAYAEANIRLAAKLRRGEEQTLWRIDHIATLIKVGRLEEAGDRLNAIAVDSLSPYGKRQYYAQRMFLAQNYTYYIEKRGLKPQDRSLYFALAQQFRDTLMRYIAPDMPEYLNIVAWRSIDTDHRASVTEALKKKIDAAEPNTVATAVGAYTLAALCRDKGDKAAQLHYLVLSAVAYIHAGCRNYDSETIQDLCEELLWEGDIARAYAYINYCSENLLTYRSRPMIERVAELKERIAMKFMERERSHTRAVTASFVASALLALALVAVLLFLRRKMRQLSQSHGELHRRGEELATLNAELRQALAEKDELWHKIERRNTRLAEANASLTEANNRLEEANAVKEQYIAYGFSLSAQYLDKLDLMRKTVSRRLKVGQREQLAADFSRPEMLQDEIRSFREGFDKAFLELYPDFVERLNTLMLPGQEMEQKDPQRLGTDLRILALMRLGITDCNKIADFLHCSVQSIYNSRRATYARLNIPPKEFKERIATLGVAAHN